MLALDEAGLVAYQRLPMLQAIHRSNSGRRRALAIIFCISTAAIMFAALAVFAQRWGGVRLFEKLLLAIADKTGWNLLGGVAGLDAALKDVYRLRGRLALAGAQYTALPERIC